jgi:hypothetical protein
MQPHLTCIGPQTGSNFSYGYTERTLGATTSSVIGGFRFKMLTLRCEITAPLNIQPAKPGLPQMGFGCILPAFVLSAWRSCDPINQPYVMRKVTVWFQTEKKGRLRLFASQTGRQQHKTLPFPYLQIDQTAAKSIL